MLFFQRQCKSVNDRSQNFKQFGDAIEAFCLVHKLEENVVNRASDVRSKVEKFAIDAMERGLQEITFTRIFGVEEFQKLTSGISIKSTTP